MKLYEITGEIEAILERVEARGGEILPDDVAALDALNLALEVKVENICHVLRDIEGDIFKIMKERNSLDNKKERLERQAANLKNYLGSCLGERTKLKAGIYSVGWRESTSVDVVDPDSLPDPYWRTKTTREPDKTVIAQDLKSELNVPGARLVKKQNLQIR